MNNMRDLIDEVKNRCDIVSVISQYINLKSSGSNYSGLCPFHNEKTGSFHVNQKKQIERKKTSQIICIFQKSVTFAAYLKTNRNASI